MVNQLEQDIRVVKFNEVELRREGKEIEGSREFVGKVLASATASAANGNGGAAGKDEWDQGEAGLMD